MVAKSRSRYAFYGKVDQLNAAVFSIFEQISTLKKMNVLHFALIHHGTPLILQRLANLSYRKKIYLLKGDSSMLRKVSAFSPYSMGA